MGDASSDAVNSKVLELVPKPLSRFAGFSFIQCWTLALFSSPYFAGSADLSVSRYVHGCSSLASVLCALCVLLAATRLIPLSRHRGATTCAGVAAALGGVLVVAATNSLVPPALEVVGFLIAGVGTAWVFLCWQEYVSTQGANKVMGTLLFSSAAAGALYVVIHLLPAGIACICCLALPLLAALTLRPSSGTRYYHTNNVFAGTRALLSDIAHDVSPRLMVVCCLTSCAYGCLRSYQSLFDSQTTAFALPALALCAAGVVSCAVVALTRGRGLGTSLVVGIVVCAVGVATLMCDPLLVAGVPGAFGMCASNAVYYTVWLVLLERARVRKLPIIGLLASLWMANFLGVLAGQVIGAFVGPDAGAPLGFVGMACLLAAALVYAGVRGMQGRVELSSETLSEPAAPKSDEKALLLAERCGLSARETEIMLLWVTGHTASYLEEQLFISRNTVKTHLRHIYRKTGVSDRDALLTLIDSQKPAS